MSRAEAGPGAGGLSSGASPRLYALVPCAGVGERAGMAGPKQYAEVAGRTLVAHTLDALSRVARLTQVLVVLSAGDTGFKRAAPGFTGWTAGVGGATRAHTVLNGLGELRARGADVNDWVLVHDAARCLLRPEWVDALIDACLPDEVGGLLAWPCADTLKRADAGARVGATVDRHGIWQAQTPQMFRVGMLEASLRAALSGEGPQAVTDEASALEAAGHSPLLVRGAFENFKLTYPEDFLIAERLLQSR